MIAGLPETPELIGLGDRVRRVGNRPVEAFHPGWQERADLLGAERDHEVGVSDRHIPDSLGSGVGNVHSDFAEHPDGHRMDPPRSGSGAEHLDSGRRVPAGEGFGKLAARRVGDAEEDEGARHFRPAECRGANAILARRIVGIPKVLPVLFAGLLAACEEKPAPELPDPDPVADPDRSRPSLIAFGDSLTAGYGIDPEQAWPARLEDLLKARGHALRVVNAGVSGETSSGGLRRLPWVLDREPNAVAVVIALGGNDGLRGIPSGLMEENLRGMVKEARSRGLPVLLAGVPSPPELGGAYRKEFAAAFRSVAEEAGAPLLESLLEGVAGVAELNQRDGIHPNPEGASRIAETVLAAVTPLVRNERPPALVIDPE